MQLPNLDHMKLLAAIEHADQLAKAARQAWLKNRTKENELIMENLSQLQDALFSLGCQLQGMTMDIGSITVKDAWAVVNG